MNEISILIVVDTEGALASGSLKSCVHSIDTEGYLGSWGEGTNSLRTICQDGQTLSWRVVSVSPGNEINLTEFSGKMVNSSVCNPNLRDTERDQYWQGQVESRGQFAEFAYTATVESDGNSLSFSGSIKVV